MATQPAQPGSLHDESASPAEIGLAFRQPMTDDNDTAFSSGAQSMPTRSTTLRVEPMTASKDTPSFAQPFSQPSAISDQPSMRNTTTVKDSRSLSIQPLGKARRKKHLNLLDIGSVFVALICLAISVVAVSPRGSVPWRLGLKRQLQVVGLMLSVMNQCLRMVTPKAFLMIEAWIGESYLQNYDAILRNSIFLSHTGLIWRIVLLALIALPTGLSVAYKEYIQGSGGFEVQSRGGIYGMTGPGGLSHMGQSVGVSLMVNASLPFILASSSESIPPPLEPRAYGFNTLLFPDNRTALLDAPMPDYVATIQGNLTDGETRTLKANVTATIAKYNNTPETHRHDNEFWNYYINKQYTGTGNISKADLYNEHEVLLLVNNYNDWNASWCFLATAYTNESIPTNRTVEFMKNAMEFNVRRDLCQGSWLISNDSIQLINGTCDQPPLDDDAQKMFTNTTLAFSTYYLPVLSEYVGPFATVRNNSRWLLPTFTTVVAGMYWSRTTAAKGYGSASWGLNKSVDIPPSHPWQWKRSDVYYHVQDKIISAKPTMHATWILYLILAAQPILTVAAFMATLFYYQTPLDSGFGMVAILAGVRQETLKLLWGASMSGELSKPVRMKIAVDDPVTTTGKFAPPEVEYILGGEGKNESLSHALRFRDPYFANKFHGVQNKLGRSGTQYEMLSR